ncbi:hypothetical protein GGU10DRAFT_40085 [Lentinula aff. detonsa]|uniref:Uncharacterized protein n=1 Tax=Lentinula aff. detonsa TaxID=2804958 RepID=A0AA38K7A8_9AGAR|nr:hypothetical protein GGU10DRAFT_40085 [Lentinula aff. detonsa]
MGLWVLHILFPSPNLLLLIAPPGWTIFVYPYTIVMLWAPGCSLAPRNLLLPFSGRESSYHRHHNCSSGPYACFCTCDTPWFNPTCNGIFAVLPSMKLTCS